MKRFTALTIPGAFACALALAASTPAPAAQQQQRRPAAAAPARQAVVDVDVALILVVDVSGSIYYEEAELQRNGIAQAFLSDDVVRAIQGGSHGRIGVSVVFFASNAFGYVTVPVNWMVIQDKASAQAFVRAFVAAPRRSARGTAISDGLELAMRQFDLAPYRAVKRTIDVSGDGPNNAGRPMLDVRREVLAKGITINGLAIMEGASLADLDKYFQGCVIGGPGSFALAAKTFNDFARAIRRKLVLEISGLTPYESDARLIPAAAVPRAAPVLPQPNRGAAAEPYAGGCDFPMFGGYGFGFR
jgi:hypothetical protein